jgi:hypothetical protein
MRFDEDLMKILPSSTAALNNRIKNLVSALKPGFYTSHKIISRASGRERKPVQMIAYSAF